MHIVWVLLVLIYLLINSIITVAMMTDADDLTPGQKVIETVVCLVAGLPIMIIMLIIALSMMFAKLIKDGDDGEI